MDAGNHLTVLGVFLAGILSFLSPCVLPLTPVYVARLVGPAVWEGQRLAPGARARLRTATLLHSAAFVAGFSLIFISLGAGASLLGSVLAAHTVLLRQIGGIVLVLFGLHIAGLLRLPGLDRERRPTVRLATVSYPGSFLIGLVFALGWTPCVGPVLAGVLALAVQTQTLHSGVLLLAVYSLGLGVPFLALGLAFDRLAPALKRLTPHLRLIELITGLLLVLMGVVIFFNWLLIVNGWIVVPGLT